MRAASIVAGLLILWMPAFAAAQEWTEFVSREDRFTANFPGPPQVTTTTYTSQFGADLPARVYSAVQEERRQVGPPERADEPALAGRVAQRRDVPVDRAPSRYSLTVVDYAPLEKLLTAKSKSCPAGAETCRGNASPSSSTGAGYWKVDFAGAVVYATWQFMQRDAKVTELVWNNIDLVEGNLLHLTNADKSRTYAGIFMHDGRLYISEATVPAGSPEPGLFQQSLGWIDENGRGIRYQTLYHHGLPVPPRAR